MKSILQRLFRQGGARPASPPRRRFRLGEPGSDYPLYAIGDVHGCLDQLLDAERRIRADARQYEKQGLTILLGDYVDRGPRSAAVLEHLARPADKTLKRVPLCGNHDDVFLQFLRNPGQIDKWLEFGGRQTLLSYGMDAEHLVSRSGGDATLMRTMLREIVPAHHVEFLESLPVLLEVGDYVFVHAGLRPEIPMEEQRDEDLMWIRQPFLSKGPMLPKIVIHGHTPVDKPQFMAGRIGIDTGAYYSGHLAVLKIIDGKASIL
ncbi:metallophosphoesterase family protein [Neorhizobium sp. NPDC001467]|uniref:metallophosphoesterase family protein n=1 Tax=Neorhizobium sp. NPDC001467 TaxID=3390595 RepID=UPI003D011130